MPKLRRFALPDGLLIAAGLVATTVEPVRAAVSGVAPTLLYAAAALGALLSLRFHRGRALLVLASLLAADRLLAWAGPGTGPEQQATVAVVAVLLPLLIGLAALLPERGALTSAGIVRLALLAFVGLLAYGVVYYAATPAASWLYSPLLPPRLTAWTTLPHVALALGLAAGALFLLLWLREPSAVARGLFWTMVAALLAVHAVGRGAEPTLWFAVAALTLSLSIIEASYALAYHDPLTGLPGRRALNEALHQPGEHYTVAMVDVDHFKQCNDRYGHDVGDQVLKMVAAQLDTVRGAGRAFRYGGEEFALLFSGVRSDVARERLEQLRQSIAASTFSIRSFPRPRKKPPRVKPGGKKTKFVAVTVSIGVAEGNGKAPPDEVLRAADKALYRAKENGRNRIEEQD